MSSKKRGARSASVANPNVERRQLERQYRDQLPKCDGQDLLLRVHLSHLVDRLAALSGLQIIMGDALSLEEIRSQTLFVCGDICVNSVSELLGSIVDVVGKSALFRELWDDFKRLHCLIREDAKEQELDTAIHSLFFGAVALFVLTEGEDDSFALEDAWLPIARALVPEASFDGSANEQLAQIVGTRLRKEIEKVEK